MGAGAGRSGSTALLRGRAVVLAVLLIASTPAWMRADDAVPGLRSLGEAEGEVTVDAASIAYDQQTNVVTARGAVKVVRGDMVLTADTVRVNRTTRVAEAEGDVVLTDPEGSLTADFLSLDLVEETGQLTNGSIFLEKNRYQLTGRTFDKLPGQSYRVEAGSFTTCLCPPGEAPDWSVRGERVTLDINGYGRVRGGTFEIKGVPVFYVPYGIFPLRRERQTGFLLPRFGASDRRGFQVEQPFYVDISKSMDATVSVDLETAARVGLLSESRYALSQDTLGELRGSYFNEQIRGAASEEVVNRRIADPDIPVNRWSAGLTHDQWLPAGVRGFADVLRVSDDLFLREINTSTFYPGAGASFRSRRFDRSRVGIERLFDRGVVTTTGTWHQDFINPDEFVFRTLPRLEGLGSWRLWDDRVTLSLAAEGVNFERDEGFEGQRLDLQPVIEVPWRIGNYAYGSWRGGLRETLYTLDDSTVPVQVNVNPADPGSKPPSILPALEEDASRELLYLRGEVHTLLARVIPVRRFGLAALKHTIEPTVDYLFVPGTDTRQEALPLFDDADRVNRRSVFSYGVTSRLLARAAGRGQETDLGQAADAEATPETARTGGAARGAIRELGRVSVFQSYDVNNKGGDFIDEIDQETGKILRNEGDHASDLALHLRLTPAPFLGFEGRTDYSVSGGRPKGATVGVSIADPRTPSDDFQLASLRGRSQLGLGYRFVAGAAVEEVNWSVLLRLSKRFYGAYESRYDNLSRRFLENRYGLRVISDRECWVIDIGFSDRINPDEKEVRVLVTLVGLGQAGSEPFRRSPDAIAVPVRSVLGE